MDSSLRTAAKQALEACEQRLPLKGQAEIIDELNNLRAALAEPVQEPVTRLFGTLPVYDTPPQRKPLAEWQINDLMADIDPEDIDPWSFRQGVYAAQKHHGIKT